MNSSSTLRVRADRLRRVRSHRRSCDARKLRKNHQFFERVRVSTGPYDEVLDFAVANGSIVQLAQAWSFSAPEQEDIARRVRAWGWTMRHVRDSGAQIRISDRVFDIK